MLKYLFLTSRNVDHTDQLNRIEATLALLVQLELKMSTTITDVLAAITAVEGDVAALANVQKDVVTEIGSLVAKLAVVVDTTTGSADLDAVVTRLTASHAALVSVTDALTAAVAAQTA